MRVYLTAVMVVVSCIVSFAIATPVTAALPPLELVEQSVQQHRAKTKKTTLDLAVTLTEGELVEWRIRGTFAYGAKLPGPGDAKIDENSKLPLRFLWIAVLASDPVAELNKVGRFVDARITDVQLQEEFVYVYGGDLAFRVFRDLQRVAGFDAVVDGVEWTTRVAWDRDRIVSVVVARDGRTVLAARDTRAPAPRSDDD